MTEAIDHICNRLTTWEASTAPRIVTINARLDQLRGVALVLRAAGMLTEDHSARLQAAAHDLVFQRQGIIRAQVGTRREVTP